GVRRAGTSPAPPYPRRDRLLGPVHRALQLFLDLVQQAFLQLGHADLLDQLDEEPTHDQSACLVVRDAPGLEIEQLLVVETPCGRSVSGSDDLAGLDLQ